MRFKIGAKVQFDIDWTTDYDNLWGIVKDWSDEDYYIDTYRGNKLINPMQTFWQEYVIKYKAPNNKEEENDQ